jgi:hypothetical protein
MWPVDARSALMRLHDGGLWRIRLDAAAGECRRIGETDEGAVVACHGTRLAIATRSAVVLRDSDVGGDSATWPSGGLPLAVTVDPRRVVWSTKGGSLFVASCDDPLRPPVRIAHDAGVILCLAQVGSRWLLAGAGAALAVIDLDDGRTVGLVDGPARLFSVHQDREGWLQVRAGDTAHELLSVRLRMIERRLGGS